MDKYDYVTATIEEEKVRLEKIIAYLKDNDPNDDMFEYQERYNNVIRYLNLKKEYYKIEDSIKDDKDKLDELNKVKDEYEVDNILLEDTLLSSFHKDTNNEYRNLLYENIKNEDSSVRDILYLVFEKQSSYSELIKKRNKLICLIDKDKYVNTYNTLVSQSVLIEKQNNILDEIFLIENNINIVKEKQKELEESVMTTPILKILYEFWIVDSYDRDKVNRNKVFKDNRSLVSIKNNIVEDVNEDNIVKEKKDKLYIPNLNLPGVNEELLVNIDGKNYVKSDE